MGMFNVEKMPSNKELWDNWKHVPDVKASCHICQSKTDELWLVTFRGIDHLVCAEHKKLIEEKI